MTIQKSDIEKERDRLLDGIKKIRELVFISSNISVTLSTQISRICDQALDNTAGSIVVKAPQQYIRRPGFPVVFLAGTIDNGLGRDWQSQIELALSDLNCMILNPRRDIWDPALGGEKFREQVQWEQDALADADLIIFYFDHNSQSPITLMELGQYASADKGRIVFCPNGFWRKGNVDFICEAEQVPVYTDEEEFIAAIRHWLNDCGYMKK